MVQTQRDFADAAITISSEGLVRCPGCMRHVVLQDEVADTVCPVCGTPVLAAAQQAQDSGLGAIVRMGGRAGAVAAALRGAAGPPPQTGQRRDPAMDGDPAHLHRAPHAHELAAPHPTHVVWELTLQCDLACVHCGSRAGQARDNELSTEECYGLIEQFRELGVREITLIGGEAYLRDDWTRVAARITERGMLCTMVTGARALGMDRVRAAEDAGIASIGISIDGLERTHDAQRGLRGSWRAAVDAAERVARSAVRLTTNSQINAMSAPEIPALARLLRDVGSAAWQVQLTVAMGRSADRPQLLLQPADLLDVFPLLVFAKEYVLDPAGIALVPGNNVGYFSPFEPLLRYGGELGAHWTSCAAGRWVLGLEADGRLKGCPSLATEVFAGGNVRHTPVRELMQTSALAGVGRRTRDDLWGYCRDCHYADVCLGGCTWTTHSLLGRLGNNPMCIHRVLDLEAQGLAERLVPVARAPRRPFDTGRHEIACGPAERGASGKFIVGVPVADIVAAGPRDASVGHPAQTRHLLKVTTAALPLLVPDGWPSGKGVTAGGGGAGSCSAEGS